MEGRRSRPGVDVDSFQVLLDVGGSDWIPCNVDKESSFPCDDSNIYIMGCMKERNRGQRKGSEGAANSGDGMSTSDSP